MKTNVAFTILLATAAMLVVVSPVTAADGHGHGR